MGGQPFVFKGIRFGSTSALMVSALLLGLANTVLSLVLGAFVLGGSPDFTIQTSPAPGSVWL